MFELLGMLLFLGLIGLSIGLHEIGHLVPAKKFGVKVTEYAIGFGPTIFRRQVGETDVRLRLLPVGGFIRMIGMYLPVRADGKKVGGRFADLIAQARAQAATEIAPEDEARTFYRLSVPKRLVIMIGGPFMNLVLATILFTIMLVGIGSPQVTNTVAEVVPCVPTAADVAGEGSIAGCIDSPETPAAAIGLQPGDVIVQVNQTQIIEWEDLAKAFSTVGAEDSVQVVIERGGSSQAFEVVLARAVFPVYDEAGNLTSETVERPFLGVSPEFIRVREPLSAVPTTMWDLLGRSVSALAGFPAKVYELGQSLITGEMRDPNGPISVVGVTRIGGEIAASELTLADKAFSILSLAAGLNLFLFLFNLLPILPLDGGHAAGATFEGLRRLIARLRKRPDPGPADIARLLPLTYVFSIVLFAFGALVIFADIVSPISLFG